MKINKNPQLCRDGICYVGRGWQDSGDEPSWYLNFTMKPVRSQNRFYYIDYREDFDPDCVADLTKKIDPEDFGTDLFAVVVLEFLPTSCFDPGTYTIANATMMAKKGGLIMVMSSQDTANVAAQRMREAGLSDVKVIMRVSAQVYSEKGVEMARKANAMLTFRLEPQKFREAFGSSAWSEAEDLGAEMKELWIAYGKK